MKSNFNVEEFAKMRMRDAKERLTRRTVFNDPQLDREERIKSTKALAKTLWPLLLFPVIGWALYAAFLFEMRHGRRM